MSWNKIFGRLEIKSTLQAGLVQGKAAHACLFYGPEGIGKRTLARAYAAALNCSGPAPGLCGECLSCRKAATDTHPDIHWVAPDGKSLKIEQMRKVKKSAYLKPHEGRYQVFILEGADSLTAEAANSLLKVLEEPPPAAKFILLAQNPSSLPPTIVSRCLLFSLPRLDEQSMALILDESAMDCSPEEAKRLIRLAEGIPGRLVALLGNDDWHQSYQEAIGILSSVVRGGSAGEEFLQLAEKEHPHADLESMLYVLRDLLVIQTTQEWKLVTNKADAELLGSLVEKWPATATMEAIEAILKLLKDLQSPINTRLALERAMRRLKEVLTDANSCGYSF